MNCLVKGQFIFVIIPSMDESKLTLEDLGRKEFKMYQLRDGFRFGTDTVLLSWFTASFIKEGKKTGILELGANCGAASLLLAARRENAYIDALEIEADAYEVLKRNIETNGLFNRINAYNNDVRELPECIRIKQYDVVFMNPPFYNDDMGPSSSKIGRYEYHGGLSDFISAAASRLVPSKGVMTIVMSASRADEVMNLMRDQDVKPFRFMSVHPASDKKAKLVLIAGKKTDANTLLEIMPPLILNDKDKMDSIYNGEHKDCFI